MNRKHTGENHYIAAGDLKSQKVWEKRLGTMKRQGVSLYLEGRPSTPGEIVKACVKEESSYMADFVLDEKGLLKELRYDKVTCE